jgi:hypothetical protein
MDERENKQQEELEKTYSIIAKKLLKGEDRQSCVKYLLKRGIPSEFAFDFVERVYNDAENFKNSPNYGNYLTNLAIQRLVTGVSWLVMGLVLRAVNRSPISDGFVVVMLIFGLAYIFFGLYSWVILLMQKRSGR